MPDECPTEGKADAAFWEAQEPWLAAVILVSGWPGEAGGEALTRALRAERAGVAPAVDFWLEVYGCVRSLG